MMDMLYSILFGMVATSHMWLLNIKNVISRTVEKLKI